MSTFSSVVTDHWIPQDVGGWSAGEVVVIVDPSLTADRSVSLLRISDGPSVLAVTPQRASDLSLSDGSRADAVHLAGSLEQAGIALHDPDHIFYLPVDDHAVLRDETVATSTRRLTDDDAAAFARLVAEAPEDDLDDAFVELDHWLVFGTFVDGRLVCAASMYPWRGTRLADLGVVTLPEFRGRGLGRATVRAISAAAIEQGYEPQYRCQLDNAASIALATSAGFAHFGEWEVEEPAAAGE